MFRPWAMFRPSAILPPSALSIYEMLIFGIRISLLLLESGQMVVIVGSDLPIPPASKGTLPRPIKRLISANVVREPYIVREPYFVRGANVTIGHIDLCGLSAMTIQLRNL